jgi:hypothetical protein
MAAEAVTGDHRRNKQQKASKEGERVSWQNKTVHHEVWWRPALGPLVLHTSLTTVERKEYDLNAY